MVSFHLILSYAFPFLLLYQLSVLQSNVPPAPTLTVMSLNLVTCLPRGQTTNEILAVSAAVHRDVSMEGACANEKRVQRFSLIRKYNNFEYPFDFQTRIRYVR